LKKDIKKGMKIRNLKNCSIPSYILDIWEERYSSYLLPLQEEAVRNYGSLSCDEVSMRLPSLLSQGQAYFASRNDRQWETLSYKKYFYNYNTWV